MQELIRQSPHLFKPDQQFQPASIRLFEMSVRNLPDRAGLEKIGRDELLGLVAEIESLAVETGYGKIGTTGDEEFNRLAAEIDAETAVHQQTLAGMLAQVESKVTLSALRDPSPFFVLEGQGGLKKHFSWVETPWSDCLVAKVDAPRPSPERNNSDRPPPSVKGELLEFLGHHA